MGLSATPRRDAGPGGGGVRGLGLVATRAGSTLPLLPAPAPVSPPERRSPLAAFPSGRGAAAEPGGAEPCWAAAIRTAALVAAPAERRGRRDEGTERRCGLAWPETLLAPGALALPHPASEVESGAQADATSGRSGIKSAIHGCRPACSAVRRLDGSAKSRERQKSAASAEGFTSSGKRQRHRWIRAVRPMIPPHRQGSARDGGAGVGPGAARRREAAALPVVDATEEAAEAGRPARGLAARRRDASREVPVPAEFPDGVLPALRRLPCTDPRPREDAPRPSTSWPIAALARGPSAPPPSWASSLPAALLGCLSSTTSGAASANGVVPARSSYARHPSDHMSAGAPCWPTGVAALAPGREAAAGRAGAAGSPLSRAKSADASSGQRYSGVPQRVERPSKGLGAWTDHPKSASFTAPDASRSRFSGLMSRWSTLRLWQCRTASTTAATCTLASSSSMRRSGRDCNRPKSSPPGQNSTTTYARVWSWKYASTLAMFGWRRRACVSTSLRSWVTQRSRMSAALLSVLIATLRPVGRWVAAYTRPNRPLPRARPIEKSRIVSMPLSAGGGGAAVRAERIPACRVGSAATAVGQLAWARKSDAALMGSWDDGLAPPCAGLATALRALSCEQEGEGGDYGGGPPRRAAPPGRAVLR